MTSLTAAPPIEPPAAPVGRRTVHLIDGRRDDRPVTFDVWFPAADAAAPRTHYEPIPGVSFESANAHEGAAPAPGTYPLVFFSHGRTGMRFAYSLLLEAIAARGFVVAAPDHAGDVMNDWLGGTFADDRTNEINRIGDSRFVLDALLGVGVSSPDLTDVAAVIDGTRIASIGHSYGAYTALASVGGGHGLPADDRIGAVVGLQPYTRSMSDTALGRVRTPTLLVLSQHDRTAPITTDGERPWQLIPGPPVWRLDLHGSAHHASSDMGLYLELASKLPDLPTIVQAYVAMMTPEMIGEHLIPWRQGLEIQLRAICAFLDVKLSIDELRGELAAGALADTPGITLQRRWPR